MKVLRPARQRFFFGVQIILLVNILVFVMWITATDAESQRFMFNNFLVSWTGIEQGRWWTLLTTVFSHNMFLHIFINMYVLMSFGSFLEKQMGTASFLKLYFIAGLLASWAHVLSSKFLIGQPDLPALGASGAVAGVIACFSVMFPQAKILLLGIIPMPALFGVLVFVGLDLWGLVAQAQGHGLPIGHGAHLGGAFTGVLFAMFKKRFS